VCTLMPSQEMPTVGMMLLGTLKTKRYSDGNRARSAILGQQYRTGGGGPLLDGALFAWQAASPCLLTSLSLLVIGVVIALHRRSRLSTVSLVA